MTKDLVSIIVPVYKKENYLAICIESILSQTYTNFELILIDDGSPDKCGEICDEYAKKERRIKVIHQENGGVNAARYNGYKHSSGNWIMFVDADDHLPQNAIQSLIKYSSGVDLVYGNTKIYHYTGDKISSSTISYKPGIYNGKDYINKLLKHEYQYSIWGKLINRHLLSGDTLCLDRDIVYGEDFIINLRMGLNINKYTIISDVVYYYNYYPQNTSYSYKMTQEYSIKYTKLFYECIDKCPFDIKESLFYFKYSEFINKICNDNVNLKLLQELKDYTKSNHVSFNKRICLKIASINQKQLRIHTWNIYRKLSSLPLIFIKCYHKFIKIKDI